MNCISKLEISSTKKYGINAWKQITNHKNFEDYKIINIVEQHVNLK